MNILFNALWAIVAAILFIAASWSIGGLLLAASKLRRKSKAADINENINIDEDDNYDYEEYDEYKDYEDDDNKAAAIKQSGLEVYDIIDGNVFVRYRDDKKQYTNLGYISKDIFYPILDTKKMPYNKVMRDFLKCYLDRNENPKNFFFPYEMSADNSSGYFVGQYKLTDTAILRVTPKKQTNDEIKVEANKVAEYLFKANGFHNHWSTVGCSVHQNGKIFAIKLSTRSQVFHFDFNIDKTLDQNINRWRHCPALTRFIYQELGFGENVESAFLALAHLMNYIVSSVYKKVNLKHLIDDFEKVNYSQSIEIAEEEVEHLAINPKPIHDYWTSDKYKEDCITAANYFKNKQSKYCNIRANIGIKVKSNNEYNTEFKVCTWQQSHAITFIFKPFQDHQSNVSSLEHNTDVIQALNAAGLDASTAVTFLYFHTRNVQGQAYQSTNLQTAIEQFTHEYAVTAEKKLKYSHWEGFTLDNVKVKELLDDIENLNNDDALSAMQMVITRNDNDNDLFVVSFNNNGEFYCMFDINIHNSDAECGRSFSTTLFENLKKFCKNTPIIRLRLLIYLIRWKATEFNNSGLKTSSCNLLEIINDIKNNKTTEFATKVEPHVSKKLEPAAKEDRYIKARQNTTMEVTESEWYAGVKKVRIVHSSGVRDFVYQTDLAKQDQTIKTQVQLDHVLEDCGLTFDQLYDYIKLTIGTTKHNAVRRTLEDWQKIYDNTSIKPSRWRLVVVNWPNQKGKFSFSLNRLDETFGHITGDFTPTDSIVDIKSDLESQKLYYSLWRVQHETGLGINEIVEKIKNTCLLKSKSTLL